LRRSIIPSLTVLSYHRVGPLTVDWSLPHTGAAEFERQVDWLNSRYHVLGAEELYGILRDGAAFPRRAALITFDDGYKDNCTNAFPILKAKGIPAIIFLTTGNIEKRRLFWWDELRYAVRSIYAETKKLNIPIDVGDGMTLDVRRLVHFENSLKEVPESVKAKVIAKLIDDYSVDIPSEFVEGQLLTWEEANAMAEGGMEFGAHTIDHSILTRMSLEEARMQISGSKETVEKRVGRKALSFAYPNGTPEDYNDDIISHLKSSGFVAAFTTQPLINPAGVDPMRIGRVGTPDDRRIFDLAVSGFPGDIGKITAMPSEYIRGGTLASEDERFFRAMS